MPFEKGKSGNPAGRPIGAKNKTPEALREAIKSFLFDKLPDIEAAWENLDDTQRIQYWERFARHIIPAPVQLWERMNEKDFSRLVEELKRTYAVTQAGHPTCVNEAQ